MKTDMALNATIKSIAKKKKRKPAGMPGPQNVLKDGGVEKLVKSAGTLKPGKFTGAKTLGTLKPGKIIGAKTPLPDKPHGIARKLRPGKFVGAKGLATGGKYNEESETDKALEGTSDEFKALMKTHRTKGAKAAEALLREQMRKKNKNR